MTNNTATKKLILSDKAIHRAMSYVEYRSLVDELLTRNLVTGNEQSDAYLEYTRLNVQRMNRWDKHFVPNEIIHEQMSSIKTPQTWLMLVEGWCGDASQNIPAIEKIASLNHLVKTEYLLRDENDEVMQEFLTNGTRSIPKLICLDKDQNVLWHWGPRPAAAQIVMQEAKQAGLDSSAVKERLHLWYARNKQAELENELAELLKS